jgi:tryptophan-rich sensory protein
LKGGDSKIALIWQFIFSNLGFAKLIAFVSQMPESISRMTVTFTLVTFVCVKNWRGIFLKKKSVVRFLVIFFAFDLACQLVAF